MAKTRENSQTEIFFKNAQNVEIYQGHKSEVRRFLPIQNGQNTCDNSQTEIFFKNAPNVKIYQGHKSEVTTFFTHTKWPKHL